MRKLTCSVRGCKNNSLKNKKITFFSVPKIADLRKQWIKFADTNIYFKKILVCSDHFSSEYLWEKDGKLLISSSAVPTLLPPPVVTEPDLNTKLKNRKTRKKLTTTPPTIIPREVEQPDIPIPEPQPLANTSSSDPLFFIDSQGAYFANNGMNGATKIEPCTKMENDFQSDYVTETRVNGFTAFNSENTWTSPVPNLSSGNISINLETQTNNGNQYSVASTLNCSDRSIMPGQIFINPETQVNNDDQRSVVSNSNSTDNNVMPVSQAAEEFFRDIEKKMKLKIPPYLKNALLYTGYDNAASLKNLDEEDFEEMQNFVRNQFAELFSSRQMLLEEYFGIFSHNIKQFVILPGHKKLLKAISKFLSNSGDHINASKAHIIKIEG